MSRNYKPIDLPRNLDYMASAMSPEVLKMVESIIEKKLSEGQWSTPEDMIFDPSNIEFAAYWLHKGRNPIKKGMKGHNLEAYFEPFKKSKQSWQPENFIKRKEYKLSASGDLMFAKHIEASKDILYDHVESLIFKSDFAYANLESTLSKEAPKAFSVKETGETPHINITKPQYDALVKHKEYKFNAVQIANNHIMDCGEEGARITMDQLKCDDIAFLGVYENESDANRVTYTMMDEVKIGWVTHTFSLNGKKLPDEKAWLCDITPFHMVKDVDTSRIEYQIKEAKNAGCDLVVVTLHWGLEHEFYPHPDQLEWAHKFAELGADAIICHHPHVCQPYEMYKPESRPDQLVPILYSLGNLTPAYGSAATVLSLIANLTISQGELNGVHQTLITAVELTPVAFMRALENGNPHAVLIPLRDLNAMALDSETKAYVKEINAYADLILGDSWRV
ncbi:CapA family protein [Fusibacter ferrireducens]|uniref:CapA family protein n=1 Tax=Fusibacter ferrireducens TaxID=2785058 RepID=A0ABR9ZYI2_9FIRM|nr:CapA family protein [Fusibacter ferrireducens]MBF4695530.1 CapA family protein [Fusibacter ferrireducens]